MSAPQLEIFDVEQGSEEWHNLRTGVITASCFQFVLAKSVDGKSNSKTRRTYMLKLVGERIRNEPADSFHNTHMERGKEWEGIAIQLYQERTGNIVQGIGFMKFGTYGASADGLVGDDGVVEIKTRMAHLQAELLLDGRVPSEHIAQIQGNLLVSGRKWVDFVSFCPGMPLFIQRVERSDVYLAELTVALESFEREIEEATQQIMKLF